MHQHTPGKLYFWLSATAHKPLKACGFCCD